MISRNQLGSGEIAYMKSLVSTMIKCVVELIELE